ncbi:DUF3592 domain-containing protein [Streptomyces sp. VRA16 Mangrove soil]|uniref:DUF3592 domain-containing protein n=1 Tax=Streptomyces sp. VRA16 Mangrove soil TaxID=2817434 RepID=UPI001A9E4FDF|nr:DUF3592 domain-containing protein [Streptomyces sp. VRA16 Mangrove soil]MBO1334268.1 DUF3592 domain-containing protein [Streptomyces sp. VRA16 Mangrove soil]
MEFFFFLVPVLIVAVAAAIGFAVLRRALQRQAAWRGGLTAEARCLRVFTTTSGGEHPTTTQHHVFEFTARDGRAVRFEEENGPAAVVQGDVVTVYYVAERPEQATACPPRSTANIVGTVFVLGFVGLIMAFCAFFVFAAADLFQGDF